MKDWTEAFFRAPVFDPGAEEAVAAAPDEAAFVWKALGLKKGARLLDLCCGTGRHSLLLARRGAVVLGVDKTPAYLAEARRAAAGLPNCRFVRGDMRRLPFQGQFDAAINLWTSFGYLAKASDDQAVLTGVARALKPGGLFLMELVDHAWVRARPTHRHWDRRADGSFLLQSAVLVGGSDPRVINEWTVLRPGKKPVKARFVLRGYDKPRLAISLRKAGLTPLRWWDRMRESSGPGRLIVLARKA